MKKKIAIFKSKMTAMKNWKSIVAKLSTFGKTQKQNLFSMWKYIYIANLNVMNYILAEFFPWKNWQNHEKFASFSSYLLKFFCLTLCKDQKYAKCQFTSTYQILTKTIDALRRNVILKIQNGRLKNEKLSILAKLSTFLIRTRAKLAKHMRKHTFGEFEQKT